MALIKVKILGNPEVKEYDANTVGELKKQLGLEGYQASVNGTAQGDDFSPESASLVTFAKAVKGGIETFTVKIK